LVTIRRFWFRDRIETASASSKATHGFATTAGSWARIIADLLLEPFRSGAPLYPAKYARRRKRRSRAAAAALPQTTLSWVSEQFVL